MEKYVYIKRKNMYKFITLKVRKYIYRQTDKIKIELTKLIYMYCILSNKQMVFWKEIRNQPCFYALCRYQ